MQLSQRSRLFKYAYFFVAPQRRPGYYADDNASVNLCPLFWLCVSMTLVWAVMGLAAVGGLYAMFVLPFRVFGWRGPLIVPGIVVAAYGIQWLWPRISPTIDMWFDELVEKRANRPPKSPNIVWEFIKAKKRKLCPIIEIIP